MIWRKFCKLSNNFTLQSSMEVEKLLRTIPTRVYDPDSTHSTQTNTCSREGREEYSRHAQGSVCAIWNTTAAATLMKHFTASHVLRWPPFIAVTGEYLVATCNTIPEALVLSETITGWLTNAFHPLSFSLHLWDLKDLTSWSKIRL